MVGRGPKTNSAFPALRAEGPAPNHPPPEPPGSLPLCSICLPGVRGIAGACSGESCVEPPGAELFLCNPFLCGVRACVCVCVFVCVCVCGQGQGDRNGAQDRGGEEGFLPFCIFVIREKRNFYGYFCGWSVPRTWGVCLPTALLWLPWGARDYRTGGTVLSRPRGFASVTQSPP